MKHRLNNNVTTLVGPDATVNGNLQFGRGCHIAGRVQGDVMAASEGKSQLSVAPDGKIEGNAKCASMQIQGTVVGDLICSGTISLTSSARVEGSIEYGEIEIQKGAVVTGTVHRISKKRPARAQARVRPRPRPGQRPRPSQPPNWKRARPYRPS